MASMIKIASQDGIDVYPLEIAAILSIVGHPEALVTDESWLSDFIDIGLIGSEYKAEKERIWAEIQDRFGADVRPLINLLEICRKINERISRDN